MIANKFAVYIMTNNRNTVIYVGRTDNLLKRIRQHKGQYKGFTSKYNVVKLVYYEIYNYKKMAIKREKQLKNLVRRKKEILINQFNPGWEDLYQEIG